MHLWVYIDFYSFALKQKSCDFFNVFD